ncbi:fructosamine kinase family protein [Thiomicrorhabdus sediminis]|uniref:Fructosamine kinase family protein n=1 Tax=Thiomicrorhabdus sediminis TaxID=2580412 RepID=A0A4P9K7R4_9GAMM|nr:fructosamine kinase family protein [Thiomicrorhabdus sediminis]QCU90971.1 fructosamine kinase family protein [Thiomicrorhabdus sediminis]
MDWQAFSEYLSNQLNQPIHIETAHSVAGGDIHQAYQLHCHDKNLFLKLNQAHLLPLFACEAHGLAAIQRSLTMRCPKVLGYGEYNNQAWLLMEHLELTHQGDDFERGRSLAHMHHTVNRDAQPFGWFEDNYIGHSAQNNAWHSDWTDFYGSQRLKPQLELAQLRGAGKELFDLGHQLIAHLDYWFSDYQPEASLLHGDLWGGNSAFIKDKNGNEPVIFDPACYYGDRETDLAMTELFGGFSRDFYDGYQSVFPIDAGYQQRKSLYNLYHILNHFNLFGGHYEHQALNSIKQLLAQCST